MRRCSDRRYSDRRSIAESPTLGRLPPTLAPIVADVGPIVADVAADCPPTPLGPIAEIRPFARECARAWGAGRRTSGPCIPRKSESWSDDAPGRFPATPPPGRWLPPPAPPAAGCLHLRLQGAGFRPPRPAAGCQARRRVAAIPPRRRGAGSRPGLRQVAGLHRELRPAAAFRRRVVRSGAGFLRRVPRPAAAHLQAYRRVAASRRRRLPVGGQGAACFRLRHLGGSSRDCGSADWQSRRSDGRRNDRRRLLPGHVAQLPPPPRGNQQA